MNTKEIARDLANDWRMVLREDLCEHLEKQIIHILDLQQAKLDKAREALEFYAQGLDPTHEMTQAIDGDKIPRVRVVNVIAELHAGKSGKEIYDEGMIPDFKIRLGKRARLALAELDK